MRITEAAQILGISVQTLRGWERLGKIPDHKSPMTGQRHYTKEDLNYIKAKMGVGRHLTYRKTVFMEPDRSTKRKKGTQEDTVGSTEVVKHDWEALYELNDSEFWDWYHGKSKEDQAQIIKDAPEYLVYHIMRARSATSRPEENSDMAIGIMPPE